MEDFLKLCSDAIFEQINNDLAEQKGLKIKLMAQVEMVRIDTKTGKEVFTETFFHSKIYSDEYMAMCQEVYDIMTTYQRMGSGWRFHHTNYVELSVDKYAPFAGSSYIPLPNFFENKKAIINVKNENDNECFKWVVTLCVYPANNHVDRLSNYIENSKKFNWKNIKFPVNFKDIDIFERQNPYSVNVFSYDQYLCDKHEYIYPIKINKNKDRKVIKLLLISDEEKQHYCWIKSMSRLIN